MKRLALLMFLIFLFSPVLATTEYYKTLWREKIYFFGNEWYYYHRDFTFFSLWFMNATKFFAVSFDAIYRGSTYAYLDLYRISEYGYIEDYERYFMDFSHSDLPYASLHSSSPLILAADDIHIPLVDERGGLWIFRLNMSAYIEGRSPFKSLDKLYDVYTVSYSPPEITWPFFKEEFDIRDYPMDNNITYAIAYIRGDGKPVIVYDFYDIANRVMTLDKKKEVVFDRLSDVKKVYPLHSRCYHRYDCHPLHLIYEGRSVQYGNKYGIYLREIWRGLFGYEFYDIPIIGNRTEFRCYVPGSILYWFFDIYTKQFYVKAQDEDRRPWVTYKLGGPAPSCVFADRINWYPNNLLVSYAKRILPPTQFTYPQSGEIWFNNTEVIAPNGTTYFLVGTIDGDLNFTLEFYNNSKLYGEVSGGVNSMYPTRIYEVTLPSSITRYNIKFIYSVLSGNPIVYVYNDVYDERRGRVKAILTPNLVEAFMIHPAEKQYYPLYSVFAIQVPSEITCWCTDWISGECFNSTHRVYTRTCHPPACAMETSYWPDETCIEYIPPSPPPPTSPPPTIPGIPPVGYTGGLFNLTGIAQQYNITDSALIGITIIDRILSLAGIATLITVITVALVGYYTKSGVTAVVIALLMVLLFTILGFYPWWFGIVFIIIASLIVTLLFKGAF